MSKRSIRTSCPIVVREMAATDPAMIASAFAGQGWDKSLAQYENYLRESQEGARTVLVAEYAGQFAGYLTIVWDSDYPPFRAAGIPEIVDLNVLIKYWRKGIATALMDEAEARMAERSDVAGIGVGVTADYGAAQILYVKRGYVPDGRGLCRGGAYPTRGEQVTVDDGLTFYLTKIVRASSGSLCMPVGHRSP